MVNVAVGRPATETVTSEFGISNTPGTGPGLTALVLATAAIVNEALVKAFAPSDPLPTAVIVKIIGSALAAAAEPQARKTTTQERSSTFCQVAIIHLLWW
jgi:hypothetical protein